jgi:hypothetical protein
MNNRIKTVRVLRLGVDGDLGRHTLDPDNRGLQDIPVDGPGGGTVPDEQRGQLGAHRLVMPDDR